MILAAVAYSWERLSAAEKSAILSAIRGGSSPPPRLIEISWQDRCNIDCFFCSTAEIRAGNHALTADRLVRLFDEMSELRVKAVRLMGGGEPLFRRDAIDLINEIGARQISIADVTTNGVLLTEPMLRALYRAGCDEICISLNAANAASYAQMMRTTGKNFDRVVDNVRMAAAIKRETGAKTVLRVQFLVYRDNYRDIPEMHRVFLESGADRFWLNGLYPVRPMPAMNDAEIAEMLAFYEQLLASDYFERLERFSFWERSIADRIAESTTRVFAGAPPWRRAAIKIRQTLSTRDRSVRRSQDLHEFCLIGWYGMTLNANGDAVTCCILQDHAKAVMGSVHASTLRQIWEGLAYERFRGELREIMARRGEVGDLSESCSVDGVCIEKGACPMRSYYWADDVAFRRQFHDSVEGLSRPTGTPFDTLKGGRPRLPVVRNLGNTGVYK